MLRTDVVESPALLAKSTGVRRDCQYCMKKRIKNKWLTPLLVAGKIQSGRQDSMPVASNSIEARQRAFRLKVDCLLE